MQSDSHDHQSAKDLFRSGWAQLSSNERQIIEAALQKLAPLRDPNNELVVRRTFGERAADSIAKFGGSWTFIIFFAVIIASWVTLNSYVLYRSSDAFDPYPYILLNLFLSMLAAVQAPVILMSQNRQAAKDRVAAEHDYEVNLKAELEVRLLHEKLDELREQKWIELVEMQQRQIQMLERLIEVKEFGPARTNVKAKK